MSSSYPHMKWLCNKYWKYSKCVDCGRRCPDTKCQIKTNPSIKLQILKTKQHQMRQICLYCHSFLTKVTNRVQVSRADLITIILTLNHIIKTRLLFQQQCYLGQKVCSLVKKTAWTNCVMQEETKCEHNLNLALLFNVHIEGWITCSPWIVGL